MNCRNEMKMKKWSSQWTQFMQLRKEAWKKFRIQRGLSPWPRDTGEMLYQLSYEATDVGSRSIDLLSTSAFSKLAKLVTGRVGDASNQWHGAYSDLLPCLPGKSPGICDFFFFLGGLFPTPRHVEGDNSPHPSSWSTSHTFFWSTSFLEQY